MSVRGGRDPLSEEVRQEAADWFARMRGPDVDTHRSEFLAWRTADPAHAEAYERLLQQWERAAFLRNTGFAQDRDLSRIRQRPFPRRLLAAASIALVSVAGISTYVLQAPGQLSAQSLHLKVVTDRDRRVLSLDDDTRVTVEARSALELTFDRRARRARLSRGRARFEIPRPDPRPLVVQAGPGRVIAGPSVFEIALDRGGARVVAILGSVEIGQGDGPSGARSRRLDEGNEAVIPPSRPDQGSAPVSSDRSTNMLTFQGEPVAAAVARFNRTSARRIALAATGLDRRRISGAFRADDPLGFAHAIVAMFGGDVVDSGGGQITIVGASSSRK